MWLTSKVNDFWEGYSDRSNSSQNIELLHRYTFIYIYISLSAKKRYISKMQYNIHTK